MDTCELGFLEKPYQISLTGLLKSKYSRTLEAQVVLEVLSDLTDQALEGELAQKQVGALLVPANLTERLSSRAEAMRALDAASGGCGFAGGLGGQPLAGCLASGVSLACGLLGAGHLDFFKYVCDEKFSESFGVPKK